MRIFLVIPTLKQGGAERVMSELANKFEKKGHEIHLCLLAGGEQFYSLEPNINVYDLGFTNKGSVQKIASEIKLLFRLRNLLKSTEPDFILSFMCKYNVFTLLAASFLNINVFVSDRSNPRKTLPNFVSFLRRYTYKYAAGIVAQTSLAKELLEKETGNQNIKVISNPLKDIDLYPEIEREYIILNVGRLVPEKGQKYLLEAFSKVKNDNWKLVILGDGPLRDNLEMRTKALDINHKVRMPGSVKNVDEWLARSSIFAFSSVSEGFPNALVEAMAAGLPCVSFDCDAGPRDIIKDGENGFLVDVGDIDTFTYQLEELVENEDLRNKFSIAAKEVILDLNAEQIANQYLEFCFRGSN